MAYDVNDEDLRRTLKDVLEDFFKSPPEQAQPDEQYDNTDVDYETSIRTAYPFGDPIAVQVVNDTPSVTVVRGSIGWVGDKTVVKGGTGVAPQLIAGKNARRRTVIIVNNGSLNVAFGPANNVTFGGPGRYGSPELKPNAFVILDTMAEVWALADPASANGEDVNVIQIVEDGQ